MQMYSASLATSSSLSSNIINKANTKKNLIVYGDSRSFLNHAASSYPNTYRFNNGVINIALSFIKNGYRFDKEFNAGVSGDTAQGLDNRKATTIPQIMAKRPANEEWDLVYWVDINDAIAGISSASFLGYFRSTMLYLLGLGIKNIFVQSGNPYPIGYGGESANTHTTRINLIKAYNAGMAAECAKTPGLYFCDTYDAYNNFAGTDTNNPVYGNNDIHPGSAEATICGKIVADKMVLANGPFADLNGILLSSNPSLIGTENTTSGNTTNNFYIIAKSAGQINSRNTTNGAYTITLDSLDGTARDFSTFNSANILGEPNMPGDKLVGYLDVAYLSVQGLPAPFEIYIQENGGGDFTRASSPTGYTKGIIPGYGRQLFVTDEFTVPAGKAGKSYLIYLYCRGTINTYVQGEVYKLGCFRTYTSPNAEYSATALITRTRKNINCLTSTAAGAMTLSFPALTYVDDGDEISFNDTQGNAATNNVIIKGGTIDYTAAAWVGSTVYAVGAIRQNGGSYYIVTTGGTSASSGGPSGTGSGITDGTVVWSNRPVDSIIDGAAAVKSITMSSNYFHKKFRASKAASAWIAVN